MENKLKQNAALAIAVASSLGAVGAADAATYTATLSTLAAYNPNGSGLGNLTSSTATWSYDDVTNQMTETGGTFNVRFQITPTSILFRTIVNSLVIGNNGVASATSYSCTEGNFGTAVAASLCGNYNFGSNFIDESTATWGPGTAASRTLGGDDVSVGAQQAIASFNNFSQQSWIGNALTLSNAQCIPQTGCINTGGFDSGYSLTFTVVPVPAAAWLLGSALGVLGLARRRAMHALKPL